MINRLTRVTLLMLALAALPAGGAMAQAMGGGGTLPDTGIDTRTKLDPPPPEGGWKALANLLEALKPGVDTRLDPTPSQITDHIERLLNSGRNQEALELIEKRIAETQGQRGTDVQLMFQHARALAALGRTAEAIDLYTEMTVRFPELPEPWNNLAALHAQQGDLDRAHDALQMALRANPDYPAARANMADIQLMMALRTYRKAANEGVPGMDAKAREIEKLLKESQHP
ncbi:tetratricopeptide repeat protein [Bordetella petrii]|uniref:Tetratricopeptide repeat protein n=1 Tax=Bordetella petrii TaxID=94624 RepID=A0ABT7W6D2_9BORD|nr:tetratricopeptide repeat protein [Bordetella petrii]MDM9560677.1 tetratricopeptide repeat protein [Bordetella petrii]